MPETPAVSEAPARPKIVEPLRCSFCDKSIREVRQLIAGPAVFICDDCTDLCAEVVAEARALRRLAADGRRIVSKADAERLAWMRTWTTAAPAPAPEVLS